MRCILTFKFVFFPSLFIFLVEMSCKYNYSVIIFLCRFWRQRTTEENIHHMKIHECAKSRSTKVCFSSVKHLYEYEITFCIRLSVTTMSVYLCAKTYYVRNYCFFYENKINSVHQKKRLFITRKDEYLIIYIALWQYRFLTMDSLRQPFWP